MQAFASCFLPAYGFASLSSLVESPRMIGLQPGHIVVIVLIALLILAPSRLPSLVRGMGKAIFEFRKEVSAKSKDES